MNLWINKDFTPMLLQEIKEPFNSKDYLFELKFDGERALVFATNKKVTIYNRHHQDITYLFPELEQIKEIVSKNTIFDGEIVAFSNNRPSFSKLQERAHLKNKEKIKYHSIKNPVIYICFDILYANKSLLELPLITRKEILNNYPNNNYFIKNKYILEKGKALFAKIKQLNLEGIVAKKINSPYLINTRSANWLKIKNVKESIFYICGYTNKKSNYVISLILGEKNNNKLTYVGKVTMSKKNPLYLKLLSLKKLSENPFSDYKEKFIIIPPKYKCLVSYIEKTKTNHLRQPVFKNVI